VITCNEIIRDDATGEPIELKCTYIPETRAGVTPEGMSRVKGIIQWVEASTGSKCKINQYDRLFQCEEPGKETGNFLDDLNPNSLEVLSDAIVEPSVLEDAKDMLRNLKEEQEENNVNKLYPSMLSYQFERNGYFALDSSSNSDTLTLNRVVTLKDTWEVSSNTKQNDSSSGKTEQKTSIKTDAGPIEDARRVAFRAGTILEAKPHPDADTLVICQVDCGDEGSETRTVVAGLGGKIPLNDLVGKKIAMVTNLKPSKMRGVESTAMLLAASSGDEGMDEKVELLNIVSDSVQNGELLYLEGKEKSEPDGMMKSKGAIKAFERVKASLKVNDKGEAIYVDDDGGEYRMMSSEGPVTVASLRNVQIG
jgi:methionine--tRNA ligase beta chain